jgi:hypothetical protein
MAQTTKRGKIELRRIQKNLDAVQTTLLTDSQKGVNTLSVPISRRPPDRVCI